MTSNVIPLRAASSGFRNVLQGAKRDAAVRAASDWYREQSDMSNALNVIAMKFNISLTAAGEALLIARRDADG